VELDQYEGAAKAAQSSIGAAKKSKDAPATMRAEARAKSALEAKAAFERASKSETALAANPGDPSANLALGQFLCLFKGDWEKGLPFLSKGSDAALKLLATKDLNRPSDPARQVEVADGWWDLGEKESGRAKANACQRAAYWYGEALPNLTGLTKVKAEKRFIGPSAGKEDSAKGPGISGEAKLVIRNNGDEVIQLFVDRAKKWQPYKNINPQESLEVVTFVGTRWEAREGERAIRFDVPNGGGVWDVITDKRTSSPTREVPLVKFNVVNRRKSTLAIHWVDFDGKLRPYGEIAANETRATTSYELHRWEAHENGKVVSKYFIPVGGGTWEIR
jgi:hypothetical protein